MVDLDNEIVKVVVAFEAVSAAIGAEPHRLIVVPVGRVLAPCILRTNRADREESPRSRKTVAAPPETDRPECPLRRPAVALPLVGQNAAPAQRHRNGAV